MSNMVRYIDAEKIEYHEEKSVYDGYDSEGSEYYKIEPIAYKSEIDEIPTADVVPKSEVERLKDLNERLMSELSKAREQIAFMKRAEELDKIPKW